ncbi:hypothetical protein CVV38_00740 [Candidatus Peregrinibacteria bacterium HGW-Peregrinibacteria-1]|jgi:hypothetical protein|nr:MAG: hypothetical protein CVV38_00740 [Candidatus Peregrinibacteria bacterium HGW-Peregrinibacteria-1]
MKKTLIFTIISAFLLSACSTTPDQPIETSESTTTVETKENTSPQNFDENFLLAIWQENEVFCADLEEKNDQEKCINTVSTLRLITRSLMLNSPELCNEISNTEYKTYCAEELKSHLAKLNQLDTKRIADTSRIHKVLAAANLSGDLVLPTKVFCFNAQNTEELRNNLPSETRSYLRDTDLELPSMSYFSYESHAPERLIGQNHITFREKNNEYLVSCKTSEMLYLYNTDQNGDAYFGLYTTVNNPKNGNIDCNNITLPDPETELQSEGQCFGIINKYGLATD